MGNLRSARSPINRRDCLDGAVAQTIRDIGGFAKSVWSSESRRVCDRMRRLAGSGHLLPGDVQPSARLALCLDGLAACAYLLFGSGLTCADYGGRGGPRRVWELWDASPAPLPLPQLWLERSGACQPIVTHRPLAKCGLWEMSMPATRYMNPSTVSTAAGLAGGMASSAHALAIRSALAAGAASV